MSTFNYPELEFKGLGRSFDLVNVGDTVIVCEIDLIIPGEFDIWHFSKKNMKNRAKELGCQIIHEFNFPEDKTRLTHKFRFVISKPYEKEPLQNPPHRGE